MTDRNGARLECGDAIAFQPWYAKRVRAGKYEHCASHGDVKVVERISTESARSEPMDYAMHYAWREGHGH